MDKIEQITNALQKLMFYSYKSFLKSNDGFEIEDERNGYESEQFTEVIQSECGIKFDKATTERYGADYILHYKMTDWLAELFSAHKLPMQFTSQLKNRSGGDQIYVIRLGDIDVDIDYDQKILGSIDEVSLGNILNKLEAQLSFLAIKYQ